MSLVSVIVPTYRRENEFKNALESLALQTYLDVEIVVIDDNGNEEWNNKIASIVSDFMNKHNSINLRFIVNSPNQGSAKTRNIGIEAANGEYITFLDDDDIYLPEKIEKQVEFTRSGGYDFTITDLYLYNENDKLIDKRIRNYITETTQEALTVYHLMHHMTGTDSMMFTKKYLTDIGGFDTIDVGDEFYLMQRAIDGGGKFGYLPGCDIKAYVHTGIGGVSSGEGKIKGENTLYEHKKKYFDTVSRKARRYIRMRHHAVIAFAYLRMPKYFSFAIESLKAFLCSPLGSIKLFLERK